MTLVGLVQTFQNCSKRHLKRLSRKWFNITHTMCKILLIVYSRDIYVIWPKTSLYIDSLFLKSVFLLVTFINMSYKATYLECVHEKVRLEGDMEDVLARQTVTASDGDVTVRDTVRESPWRLRPQSRPRRLLEPRMYIKALGRTVHQHIRLGEEVFNLICFNIWNEI